MEMINDVALDDEELSILVTGLQLMINAFEMGELENGTLDFESRKLKRKMEHLHQRLEDEFF